MEEWPSSFKVDSGRRCNLIKSSTMSDFLSALCVSVSQRNSMRQQQRNEWQNHMGRMPSMRSILTQRWIISIICLNRNILIDY